MNTRTDIERCAGREKPVAGPRVAKDLLHVLREMREYQANQGTSGMLHKETEEIERWEDIIRAHVAEWRATPREVLHMDRETSAALDDACCPRHGRPVTDSSREWRQVFALRAIKAVCQAWVNASPGSWPQDLAVTLRNMTEDEKAAELLGMQVELVSMGGVGKTMPVALKIDRTAMLEGFRLMLATVHPRGGMSVFLTFRADRLSVAAGKVMAFEAPAGGFWPGTLRLRFRDFKAVAQFPPSGDPMEFQVENRRFIAGTFSCWADWAKRYPVLPEAPETDGPNANGKGA